MTPLHKNNIQVLMIMSYFIIRIVEGVHLLAVSIVDKPQIFMLATTYFNGILCYFMPFPKKHHDTILICLKHICDKVLKTFKDSISKLIIKN